MHAMGPIRRSEVVALVALAVALATGGWMIADHTSTTTSSPGTVSVSGSGTATERPDTLTISMTVRNVAKSAARALTVNNRDTLAVERVFFTAGVPRADVATANVSVGVADNAAGNPIGYAAEHDLTVTLRNLGKSGAVLGAAARAAGNDVSITSTSYSITNAASGEAAARAAAMKDAFARAQGFAAAAGERVGAIERITDTSSDTGPIVFTPQNLGATAKSAASPVPLQPGSQTVNASVNVVFALTP